jgi:hypothetical protein
MATRQSSWKVTDLLSPQGRGYFHRTQRPLHCLVFVLPWLIVFEVGMLWRQAHESRPMPSLVAWRLIERFVELLGASGLYFPGLLLVAILLGWHLVARHSWTIDKPTLAGMLGESVIWAVPLYVFNSVLQQARRGSIESAWIDDVILSIGAGIYEELVFRLIAITLLSLILIDVFSLQKSATMVFIFLFSAALFAAQHHQPFGNDPFDTVKFLFRTAAGLYLTGIFVFRGFGIAAGAHAVYDVVVVTIAAIHSAGQV